MHVVSGRNGLENPTVTGLDMCVYLVKPVQQTNDENDNQTDNNSNKHNQWIGCAVVIQKDINSITSTVQCICVANTCAIASAHRAVVVADEPVV